jgi:hypothetical protein
MRRRIERRGLLDHGNELVEFCEHALHLGSERREIGCCAFERLGDLGLILVLQQVVHRPAAGIDVEFDAVPGRVIGLKGLPRRCRIALLHCIERVNERRTDRFQAGDLETLSRRSARGPDRFDQYRDRKDRQ